MSALPRDGGGEACIRGQSAQRVLCAAVRSQSVGRRLTRKPVTSALALLYLFLLVVVGLGPAWLHIFSPSSQEATPGDEPRVQSQHGRDGTLADRRFSLLGWRRREVWHALIGSAIVAGSGRLEVAAASSGPRRLQTPLQYCGGGFCATFEVDGQLYRGVVDTGSPFILLSTCNEEAIDCSRYCRTWGCTSPRLGEPSGLEDTDEVFVAGSARVTWRRGSFGFGGEDLGKVTYGAMLDIESYQGNGGGAFLGLIKDKIARIRPTVLGQTGFRRVEVDLRQPGQEQLILSEEKVPASNSSVKLVDLRPLGAPVRYYSAEVSELRFGDVPVRWPGRIIAVLDTGTTGMAVPPELFELYDRWLRRKGAVIGLRAARKIEVDFATEDGGMMTLAMRQGEVPEYRSAFDFVSANPEPVGMSPDAEALWAALPDNQALNLAGATAQVRVDGQAGFAQAIKPLSPGQSFKVRLVPSAAKRFDLLNQNSVCSIAVGLAPRGGPRGELNLGAAAGTCAFTSGELAAGKQVGTLRLGDVIECGLTDGGSAYWRINDGMATGLQKLDSRRELLPSVAASSAGCGVELVSIPSGPLRWSELASDIVKQQGRGSSKTRPLTVFLGLGFFVGRSISIDTVDNRAEISAVWPK